MASDETPERAEEPEVEADADPELTLEPEAESAPRGTEPAAPEPPPEPPPEPGPPAPPRPRLLPGIARALAWPLSRGQGFEFLGGVFLLLLVLLAAWAAGLVWWPFRLAVAIPGAVWFLAYPGRALRATAASREAPPDWPPLGRGPAWREGLRALLVLVLWGAVPLALALATGSRWLGLAGAIVMWTLVPAALLGFWIGGRLRYANPVLAVRIAIGGGRRYLLCVAPVIPFLVARALLDAASIWGIVLEGAAFVGLVLTAHLLGRLANESTGVRDRVETIRTE